MNACLTWSELVLARRDSEAPALAGERGVSYAELIGLADAAAGWLDELRLAGGRPVPALLDTSATSLALVIAGSCTGRPIAPLGPRLTPREIAGCIAGLGAGALIAEPGYADQAAAAAQRAGVTCAVVPGLKPGGPPLTAQAGGTATAAILHTSGTTGAPKQVLISQERLARRVAVSSALMAAGPGSVYASGSPFYHIAGLGNLAVMVAAGATILPFPSFSVAAWQDLGAR